MFKFGNVILRATGMDTVGIYDKGGNLEYAIRPSLVDNNFEELIDSLKAFSTCKAFELQPINAAQLAKQYNIELVEVNPSPKMDIEDDFL